MAETREFFLPRTLPARTMADLTPVHYVRNERGNLTLRNGAPPAAVRAAVADLARGEGDVTTMLDRIGVPR